MNAANVIIAPIVTEKSERLKAAEGKRTYTLRVHPDATKIDVEKALEQFFQVRVEKVRVLWVQPKVRSLGAGFMEKRHRAKKALVTLTKDSKALDLTTFQTRS